MRTIILLSSLAVLTAHATEKKQVEIETPHGTVEWKEGEAKSIAQVVRDVSAEELDGLHADAKAVGAFVDRFGPHDSVERHPLDVLDLAFAAWLKSDDPNKDSPDRVVRVVGSAYGFYCVEHLGLRWAWTQDEQGLAISLVRENPTTVSFPFTSIQYRIEDKKTDFIYSLFASLEHVIKEASPKNEPNQAPEPMPLKRHGSS